MITRDLNFKESERKGLKSRTWVGNWAGLNDGQSRSSYKDLGDDSGLRRPEPGLQWGMGPSERRSGTCDIVEPA